MRHAMHHGRPIYPQVCVISYKQSANSSGFQPSLDLLATLGSEHLRLRFIFHIAKLRIP